MENNNAIKTECRGALGDVEGIFSALDTEHAGHGTRWTTDAGASFRRSRTTGLVIVRQLKKASTRVRHAAKSGNPHPIATRRGLLLASIALPALQVRGAVSPVLSNTATTAGARALLDDSAAAHGLGALGKIRDVNRRTSGEWRAVVGTPRPALVDAGFRVGSEERILPHEGIIAQAHTGASGRKQVFRRSAPGMQGNLRVWFNGQEARDEERRDAAALVADSYSLFLFGPMLLARYSGTGRSLVTERAGVEILTLDGRHHECDVLRACIAPGMGFSEGEQLALFIDRDERLMRRVRFTLNGLESTRGAVAEVDMFDHITRLGVRWPTRFHERLLRPLPLPVHDWRLTGLDLNRDLTSADISGEVFAGKAAAPATALT